MGEISEMEQEKDCFEALLGDKNAECSEYISQIHALKVILGEFSKAEFQIFLEWCKNERALNE